MTPLIPKGAHQIGAAVKYMTIVEPYYFALRKIKGQLEKRSFTGETLT